MASIQSTFIQLLIWPWTRMYSVLKSSWKQLIQKPVPPRNIWKHSSFQFCFPEWLACFTKQRKKNVLREKEPNSLPVIFWLSGYTIKIQRGWGRLSQNSSPFPLWTSGWSITPGRQSHCPSCWQRKRQRCAFNPSGEPICCLDIVNEVCPLSTLPSEVWLVISCITTSMVLFCRWNTGCSGSVRSWDSRVASVAEETARRQAHSPASQDFLGQTRTESEMQNGRRWGNCTYDSTTLTTGGSSPFGTSRTLREENVQIMLPLCWFFF